MPKTWEDPEEMDPNFYRDFTEEDEDDSWQDHVYELRAGK